MIKIIYTSIHIIKAKRISFFMFIHNAHFLRVAKFQKSARACSTSSRSDVQQYTTKSTASIVNTFHKIEIMTSISGYKWGKLCNIHWPYTFNACRICVHVFCSEYSVLLLLLLLLLQRWYSVGVLLHSTWHHCSIFICPANINWTDNGPNIHNHSPHFTSLHTQILHRICFHFLILYLNKHAVSVWCTIACIRTISTHAPLNVVMITTKKVDASK